MADPFGGADEDFNDVFDTFHEWLDSHGVAHGMTAEEVSAIDDAHADWVAKYPAHKAAQTAAATAKVLKDDSRTDASALLRAAAGHVKSAAERSAAGLNVYAEKRDRVPVPTTRPVLMVDNSQRLQQTVNFRDETTPDSKKKPDGVRGCEIRYFCGDTPPADPEEFEYAGTDTATPYLLVHVAGDAGKKCWIVGRWVNTRGETGPWSESVMSTVSA